MSSVVGPRSWIPRLGAPRATHPTEVLMVSIYVIPVASSCTMWLVHIMATVGSIATSICRGYRGAFLAFTSDRSLHRQSITSQKPGGGATSHAVSRGPVDGMGSGFVLSLHRHSSTL